MTTHQQLSSQPQQSHSSPQERMGLGLMMEERVEVVLEAAILVGGSEARGLSEADEEGRGSRRRCRRTGGVFGGKEPKRIWMEVGVG